MWNKCLGQKQCCVRCRGLAYVEVDKTPNAFLLQVVVDSIESLVPRHSCWLLDSVLYFSKFWIFFFFYNTVNLVNAKSYTASKWWSQNLNLSTLTLESKHLSLYSAPLLWIRYLWFYYPSRSLGSSLMGIWNNLVLGIGWEVKNLISILVVCFTRRKCFFFKYTSQVRL